MSKIINIRSLEEIGTAAQEFVQYISSSDLQSNIFAFFGQMGAGKTTFIKAICKELGVADAVNSPTFTIGRLCTVRRIPDRRRNSRNARLLSRR